MDDAVKQWLESDDGKAFLAKQIEATTAPLKAKNAELLDEVKGARAKLSEAATRAAELDAAKAKVEEEAALKSGDVEAVKKQLAQKHERELKAYQDKLAEKESALARLVVDDGLTSALVAAGVAKPYLDGAKALLRAQHGAEIQDVDGKPTAFFSGKSVVDFVQEWAQGDAGRAYVAAPAHSGGGSGGASGGTGGGGVKTMVASQLESLPTKQRAQVMAQGVVVKSEL
jgi:hypothetical protein